MAYGVLSFTQMAELHPYIKDKIVHDLGCGDLELSRALLGLGATGVVAVDKKISLETAHRLIRTEETYFHDFHEHVETTFVSWPAKYVEGLVEILRRAQTIIYLGSNFDGTVCGPYEMWETLSRLPVLAHVPNQHNSLMIYDAQGDALERRPLPEEYAGLHPNDRIFRYEEFHE